MCLDLYLLTFVHFSYIMSNYQTKRQLMKLNKMYRVWQVDLPEPYLGIKLDRANNTLFCKI
jgi:hypothetical protein